MKIDDEKCECFLIDVTKRERCTNNWVLYLRKLLFFFYKEFSEKYSDFTAITVGTRAG